MSGLRRAYSIAGVVLLALMALQFYLIAAAAWSVWGATPNTGEPTSAQIFSGFKLGDGFASLHAVDGTFVIPFVILVMIALSFAGRQAARVKWLTGLLLLMMVVQFFLGVFGGLQNSAGSAIAGLHGLNAMGLVAVAIYLVRSTWSPAPQPSAAAVPSPTSGTGATGL